MKTILQTLNGTPISPPPIWLMRQAGRHLEEYLNLRSRADTFLDFCYSPDMAVEATLQPIRRYGMDAAILFSDILVIPDALGQRVSFVPGQGPQLAPLNGRASIKQLDPTNLHDHLAPVYESIRRLKTLLPEATALIGFAGAPWTVITYMIEGGSSRDFADTRQWLWSHPKEFEALLDYVTEATIQFLMVQARAGADVLMLFDSWASAVPAERREQIVIAPVRRIVGALRKQGIKQPIIGFPKGIGEGIISYAEEAKIDALAIDHMTDVAWVNKILPKNMPVQGNLDPLSLLVGGSEMRKSIDHILDSFKDRPHIFNLGHGITPPTPICNVEQMVQWVRKS